MTDAEKIKKLTELVRGEQINYSAASIYCGVCNTRGKTETHTPDCILVGTEDAPEELECPDCGKLQCETNH